MYVLIGPYTFSSAETAAIDFQNGLHATLVGSPTGEKSNGYWDIDFVKLPNSNLTITFSTKFFRQVKGDPPELDQDTVPEAALSNR